eukprot:Clim_evm5s85 gene=Clim_evmTU5s85
MGQPGDTPLYVLLVGFHHTQGPIAEYCYPNPYPQGFEAEYEKSSDNGIALPKLWKHMPFLCLPDGSHRTMKDHTYFILPPLPVSGPNTEYDPEDAQTFQDAQGHAIFGVAAFAQVKSDLLKAKDDQVTRTFVQKSVVVLSPKQGFPKVRERLRLVTDALFAQKDFSMLDLLHQCHASMTRSGITNLSRASIVKLTSLARGEQGAGSQLEDIAEDDDDSELEELGGESQRIPSSRSRTVTSDASLERLPSGLTMRVLRRMRASQGSVVTLDVRDIEDSEASVQSGLLFLRYHHKALAVLKAVLLGASVVVFSRNGGAACSNDVVELMSLIPLELASLSLQLCPQARAKQAILKNRRERHGGTESFRMATVMQEDSVERQRDTAMPLQLVHHSGLLFQPYVCIQEMDDIKAASTYIVGTSNQMITELAEPDVLMLCEKKDEFASRNSGPLVKKIQQQEDNGRSSLGASPDQSSTSSIDDLLNEGRVEFRSKKMRELCILTTSDFRFADYIVRAVQEHRAGEIREAQEAQEAVKQRQRDLDRERCPTTAENRSVTDTGGADLKRQSGSATGNVPRAPTRLKDLSTETRYKGSDEWVRHQCHEYILRLLSCMRRAGYLDCEISEHGVFAKDHEGFRIWASRQSSEVEDEDADPSALDMQGPSLDKRATSKTLPASTDETSDRSRSSVGSAYGMGSDPAILSFRRRDHGKVRSYGSQWTNEFAKTPVYKRWCSVVAAREALEFAAADGHSPTRSDSGHSLSQSQGPGGCLRVPRVVAKHPGDEPEMGQGGFFGDVAQRLKAGDLHFTPVFRDDLAHSAKATAVSITKGVEGLFGRVLGAAKTVTEPIQHRNTPRSGTAYGQGGSSSTEDSLAVPEVGEATRTRKGSEHSTTSISSSSNIKQSLQQGWSGLRSMLPGASSAGDTSKKSDSVSHSSSRSSVGTGTDGQMSRPLSHSERPKNRPPPVPMVAPDDGTYMESPADSPLDLLKEDIDVQGLTHGNGEGSAKGNNSERPHRPAPPPPP